MGLQERALSVLDTDSEWHYVIDLETTGLVDEPGYITEIGITDTTGRAIFAMRLDPEAPITPEAARISGLHQDWGRSGSVHGMPTFAQIYPLLREALMVDEAEGGGGIRLVGFNVEFEQGIFRNELLRLGVDEAEFKRWASLDWVDAQPFLAEHLGRKVTETSLTGADHTALGDCQATIAALELVAGRTPSSGPSGQAVSPKKLAWLYDLTREAEPDSKWSSRDCAVAIVGRPITFLDELAPDEVEQVIDHLNWNDKAAIGAVRTLRGLLASRLETTSGMGGTKLLASIVSDLLGRQVGSVWELDPEVIVALADQLQQESWEEPNAVPSADRLMKSQVDRLRNALRGVFEECATSRYMFMTRVLKRKVISFGQLTEDEAASVFNAIVKQRASLSRKLPAWKA
ncbi:hypothetical protein GCM10022221_81840 [Actinocorallia aurea]